MREERKEKSTKSPIENAQKKAARASFSLKQEPSGAANKWAKKETKCQRQNAKKI
jgi:hypothetical protein